MNDIFVVPLTNSSKICIIDINKVDFVLKYNWHLNSNGYARSTTRSKIYLHKYLCQIFKTIDHINRIKLDNRLSNLMECKGSENQLNRVKVKFNLYGDRTTSKYKGVTKIKSKNPLDPNFRWRASVWKDYKSYYIGTYKTEKEAAEAYNKKIIELHGNNVILNKI